MINKVKEFSIGDVIAHAGKKCKITKFPTRHSVCIENLEYDSGDFFTAKIPIREIGR